MKANKLKHPYGYAANTVIYDKNLSFTAKGVYLYMLSKPDEWDFSAKRIASESTTSEHMVRKSLKELEDNHLLRRDKLKNGRMVYFIIDPAQDCVVSKSKENNQNAYMQSAVVQTADMQVALDNTISKKESNKEKNISNKEEDISIHPLIHSFKDYWVHNTVGLYNKVQFKALWDLQDSLGEERLIKVIDYVNRIHRENPDYAPKIYNPTQLTEKYLQLIDFLDREGWEKKSTTKPKSVYRNL